jgi:hypothetical protein
MRSPVSVTGGSVGRHFAGTAGGQSRARRRPQIVPEPETGAGLERLGLWPTKTAKTVSAILANDMHLDVGSAEHLVPSSVAIWDGVEVSRSRRARHSGGDRRIQRVGLLGHDQRRRGFSRPRTPRSQSEQCERVCDPRRVGVGSRSAPTSALPSSSDPDRMVDIQRDASGDPWRRSR